MIVYPLSLFGARPANNNLENPDCQVCGRTTDHAARLNETVHGRDREHLAQDIMCGCMLSGGWFRLDWRCITRAEHVNWPDHRARVSPRGNAGSAGCLDSPAMAFVRDSITDADRTLLQSGNTSSFAFASSVLQSR